MVQLLPSQHHSVVVLPLVAYTRIWIALPTSQLVTETLSPGSLKAPVYQPFPS